jgi:tetratricopeptide (TPR) repeat protein
MIIGTNQIITHAYTFWFCLRDIEHGNISNAKKLIAILNECGKEYDNDLAIGRMYLAKTKLLLKYRMFNEVIKEADKGISLLKRIGLQPFGLFASGMKSYIQILMKDFKEAESSLSQIRTLISEIERVTPFHISSYLMSQFLFDLYMLEESINSNNKSRGSQLQKKAYRSGKAVVKNSMKVAGDKTEAFKLMGVYYWLAGEQKKALAWLNKSIKIGEQLGARPELARTYMEVGKRLLEKKSSSTRLNGISAEEYLGKAEALFKKMNLDWDLEELDKIKFYQ